MTLREFINALESLALQHGDDTLVGVIRGSDIDGIYIGVEPYFTNEFKSGYGGRPLGLEHYQPCIGDPDIKDVHKMIVI